jgi:hypothetical protein
VDAMLESMTAVQYQEWLAFYKIRNEMEKKDADGTADKTLMSGSLNRALDGYQNRRDKRKGK